MSVESSAVVPLSIVPAARAAAVVRTLYPHLSVSPNAQSNSVVLAGSAADIAGARGIIQGLDVRDASKPSTEALVLRTQSASVVADRLRALYPSAKITVVSRTTLLVSALPPDLTQIKSLVAGIDAPTPSPTLAPVSSDAVKVMQRRPAGRRARGQRADPARARIRVGFRRHAERLARGRRAREER